MKAKKTYIDSKQRKILAGEEMPKDYDKPTINHYKKMGIIGPTEIKPSKPKVTKKKKK